MKLKNILKNLQNFKTNFKNKLDRSSFVKGIKKGYSVSTLPVKLDKFYNHIFIRILRVIGGICFVMVVTKLYLNLPENLHLIITIISAIQITQIIIILIIKIFYGIYKLLFKKEEFEVRNSPLDRYATMIAKTLYCAKVGCGLAAGGAGFIGGGAAYDQVLVASGRDPIFVPFMGKVYISIFGQGPNINTKIEQVINNTDKSIETPISRDSITDIITKYENLSSTEIQEFLNELNNKYEEEKRSRGK